MHAEEVVEMIKDDAMERDLPKKADVPLATEAPRHVNNVPVEEPAEETPPPPPQAPTKPEQIFVSREDRLESENLQLRAIILQQQLVGLNTEIEKKMGEQQALHQKIVADRDKIQTKYGVNLTTHYIREGDGAVLPRAAHQHTLQGLMGNLAPRGNGQ